MEGTVAQSIVDPDNPRTALSVRAMLTANVSALEVLPDTGAPFSIREWVAREDQDGFLFLTSRGDQHASASAGLISTWLEIAVNAMLSLDQADDRRIWVILDELPDAPPGAVAAARAWRRAASSAGVSCSASRSRPRSATSTARNGAETISGSLRHARRPRRPRPRYRAVVGRQPGPERGRGGRRERELRRQHDPRRGVAHAAGGSSAPWRSPPTSCGSRTCTAS